MKFIVKYWLGIGAVVAGYAATVAIGATLSLRNEERMSDATQALFPATIRCQQARYAFERQLRLYEDGVVQGEPDLVQQAQSSGAEVQSLLDDTAALPLDAVERQRFRSLIGRHRQFSEAADGLYLRMASPAPPGSLQPQAARLRDEARSIRGEINSCMTRMADGLSRNLDQATAAMQHQRTVTIAAFVAIVACSLAAIAVVMMLWTRRLKSLLQASDRLAGGDYAAVLPGASDDELGRLTASFAAMRGAVKARIGELRALSAGLEETVRQRTAELAGKNASLTAEVAERQRTEHELRLLEAAITNINEAVVITTPGTSPGRAAIVHANPAFCGLTGWDEDAAQGMSLDALAGPGTDLERFEGLFATAASGGDATGELLCRRRDGRGYPAEWHVCPIRDVDGGVCNLVAVHRDISERRRSQEALEEAHRQAGMAEIATGVLHNVGNVLNSVNVSAGRISDRLADPRLENLARAAELLRTGAAQPDFLRTDERGRRLPDYLGLLAGHIADAHAVLREEARCLGDAVDHIKSIVAMQQSYARIGTSTMRTLCQASAICDDALRLEQPALDRARIAVRRDYAPMPEASLDRHRILQILVNLVANARQAVLAAAPRAGGIEVGTAPAAGGRLLIWVADDGVGIAAGDLERIFGHGFTTKPGGHGFGLHRCANAAAEMGGRLTARSDGPGRGARFELELPTGRTMP